MKSSGLFTLVLLVLATLAPWAVEGAGKAGVKAGDCPYRPPAKCPRLQEPQCRNDWQCPGQQKCCPDACTATCLDPVQPSKPVTKPGQCPVVEAECLMLNPPNQCETDGECPGNHKCCKGMCGKTCVAPVNGASSKGGARP